MVYIKNFWVYTICIRNFQFKIWHSLLRVSLFYDFNIGDCGNKLIVLGDDRRVLSFKIFGNYLKTSITFFKTLFLHSWEHKTILKKVGSLLGKPLGD